MARTTAKVHEERLRDVREMMVSGYTAQEVADTLGVHYTTAYALIHEAGCSKVLPRRRWTDEERGQLLALMERVAGAMGRTICGCVRQLKAMGY